LGQHRQIGCETLSIHLSQRADEGVSVFAADFAIPVAVATVETCLLMLLSMVPKERQILAQLRDGN
jgi:hypothetical protein